MRFPTLHGIIARRILINYRVDPQTATALLPAPFRPVIVNGFAVGGICLIRLERVRPAMLPACVGITSENAAHRFAVEWTDDAGQIRTGVYIPRRDTSSCLSVLVGGRLFPGEHHRARFDVSEADDRMRIALTSADRQMRVSIGVRVVSDLSPGCSRCFGSLADASRFFETGSVGYSATREPKRYDGMELRCLRWQVEALAVDDVSSSYFDDPSLVRPGTATFDCALLMRNVEHAWRGQPSLCCPVKA